MPGIDIAAHIAAQNAIRQRGAMAQHWQWQHTKCCPRCGYEFRGVKPRNCPQCGKDLMFP
jgi:rubrerythrin